MFKKDLMIGDDFQQIKVVASVKRTNNRRACKTLVELSIGVIGIIAVMLAQIAGHHSGQVVNHEKAVNPNVIYQLTDDIAKKVASMGEVSPMATKVNLNNILF